MNKNLRTVIHCDLIKTNRMIRSLESRWDNNGQLTHSIITIRFTQLSLYGRVFNPISLFIHPTNFNLFFLFLQKKSHLSFFAHKTQHCQQHVKEIKYKNYEYTFSPFQAREIFFFGWTYSHFAGWHHTRATLKQHCSEKRSRKRRKVTKKSSSKK
jgi:hypothetical protein